MGTGWWSLKENTHLNGGSCIALAGASPTDAGASFWHENPTVAPSCLLPKRKTGTSGPDLLAAQNGNTHSYNKEGYSSVQCQGMTAPPPRMRHWTVTLKGRSEKQSHGFVEDVGPSASLVSFYEWPRQHPCVQCWWKTRGKVLTTLRQEGERAKW